MWLGDGLVRIVAGPLAKNYPGVACGALLDRRTRCFLLQHHIARSLALPIPIAHGDEFLEVSVRER